MPGDEELGFEAAVAALGESVNVLGLEEHETWAYSGEAIW